MDNVPNPFVIGIKKTFTDVCGDIVYCIHGADYAAETFSDFNFSKYQINNNIFWFDTIAELEGIIVENMSKMLREVNIVTHVEEMEFSDDTFYTESNGQMYLLNQNNIYYADLRIVSKLALKKVDVNYVIEDNYFGFRHMKVLMKEIGLLDEIYDEKHYLEFLKKHDLIQCLLYLYRDIWEHRSDIPQNYNINNKYNNPYENILAVEDYLNSQRIYNIDTDKCDLYGLKYSKLPARYNFNGFYNTTGRIYCSSEDWAPLQNIPETKRDILYADKGCVFVEVDFKSFEFDILCQLIDMPVYNDPHTKTYNDYVGIPHENSRVIGKMINYSFIYGMNEGRLADSVIKELGIVPKDFKENFLYKLSSNVMIHKVKQLEGKLKSSTIGNMITNYFGRKIHFKKEYAVLNNYISSSASDFLYNKFRMLLEILEGNNKIILQNHDSILMQLSEKDIEHTDILEEILKIFKMPVAGINGRVEYKYGKNWGTLL